MLPGSGQAICKANLPRGGHDLRRHTPKEAKGAHMARDPIWQGLRQGRLRKGIARCPEGRDKQLCRTHLAGRGINHIDRVPRIIDEQPFARRVAPLGRLLCNRLPGNGWRITAGSLPSHWV